MSDPNAGAGMHHRLESRDQPARGMPHCNASVPLTFVDIRLTIRDDDDLLTLQMATSASI